MSEIINLKDKCPICQANLQALEIDGNEYAISCSLCEYTVQHALTYMEFIENYIPEVPMYTGADQSNIMDQILPVLEKFQGILTNKPLNRNTLASELLVAMVKGHGIMIPDVQIANAVTMADQLIAHLKETAK